MSTVGQTATGRFAKRYPFVFTTLVVGAIVLGLWLAPLPEVARIVGTTYVVVFVAWTAWGMLKDILAGHFGLDILAVVAMVATLAVGEYGAALIVVLMLSGGEALEDYAASRARSELSALMERTPQTAHLITNPGARSPEFEDVPAVDVEVGNELLVRPGEVVPVDATLISANGSFDESSITGESLPVQRIAGEEVLSGSINGETAVVMRAVRAAADSQYQQIVSLVKEAEEQKAPAVRVADRFALPFTALSLAIAGTAWAISGDPVRFAEVLVLATPCPLLIAAPVAFMGGLSRAAKNGVILKGGAVLEAMARVRSVGFDKTGTLTLGRPDVVGVEAQAPWSEDEVLAMAAAVENYSGHVLAQAVVRAAETRTLTLPTATDAEEIPGAGISAVVDGHTVVVGSASYLRDLGAGNVPESHPQASVLTYVMIDGAYAGLILMADEIRPNSRAVVSWLRVSGVKEIAMFTGDSQVAAQRIASQAGVGDVHYDLKPQQKVQLVGALRPKPSMMVGDGVNDAPALAAADVGMAMGARGATAAGEAADAVIMADQISKVADAVAISKQTLRVALTAIWLGIILSVGLMLVATTGAIPAMAGALTQEVVDLAAILYALRALTGKLPALESMDSVKTPSLVTSGE